MFLGRIQNLREMVWGFQTRTAEQCGADAVLHAKEEGQDVLCVSAGTHS